MKIYIFFLHSILLLSCTKSISLHAKHPNEIMTDDYGILTEKDLSGLKNIEGLDLGSISIPRWVCFESKNLRAKCINVEYNDSLKFVTSDLDLNVSENEKEVHLDFRAVRASSACEEHLHTWERLMNGEKYFCLSATLLEVDKSNPKKMSGFFHQLKTKKGCDSWFINDCK